MNALMVPVLVGVLTATAGMALGQGLSGENLLTGMPEGFKAGYDAAGNGQEIHELVPADETVEDWSRMVTVQIFHGASDANIAGFAAEMKSGWEGACPGGVGTPLEEGDTNGYPYVLWRFVCPLNPGTGKPELMWLKAVAGKDAAYVVQYAFRREMAPEREQAALAYLARTSACDTRDPARACPPGM